MSYYKQVKTYPDTILFALIMISGFHKRSINQFLDTARTVSLGMLGSLGFSPKLKRKMILRPVFGVSFSRTKKNLSQLLSEMKENITKLCLTY